MRKLCILIAPVWVLIIVCSGHARGQIAGKDVTTSTEKSAIAAKDTAAVDAMLLKAKSFIIKPGEDSTDLDSAIFIANRAEDISRKMRYASGVGNALILSGMANREKGNSDRGKAITQQAIDFSSSQKDYNNLGESYVQMMHYYSPWDETQMVERLRFLNLADSAYKLAGNKERQGYVLQNLGDCYQVSNKPKEALQKLKEAQLLYESVGYREMHGLYDLLGFCYTNFFNDHQNGLKYGLLAATRAEELGDSSSQMGTILSRLAQTYSALNDYDLADQYFGRAYKIFKQLNEVGNMYLVGLESASNFELSDKYQSVRYLLNADSLYTVPDYLTQDYDAIMLRVYDRLENDYQARKHVESLLKKPGTASHGLSLISLITYYTRTRNYEQAKYWLDQLDLFIKNIPAAKVVYTARRMLLASELSEKTGNYRNALESFKQYKIASDSLFNSRRTNQIAAMRTEYDTEKKDQDIRIHEQSIELLNSRNLAQQQQIRQSALIRNGILIGAAVLLTVLGLLYNQFRLKQKANKAINTKNAQLELLVDEKEWLLREVHHRVKNNLQTVVSLLESQSAYLKDDALIAIQESQNRIYAMSLIHQKLYQTENTSSIHMNEYLPELIKYLKEILDPQQRIHFDVDTDAIELDVSQAVPVGLILNEAVTNAVKYAFGNIHNHRKIDIRLTQEAGNQINLIINDNGKGLPAGYDTAKSSGLGLRLMRGLTEDLGGRFSTSNDAGTRISISFNANELLHQPA